MRLDLFYAYLVITFDNRHCCESGDILNEIISERIVVIQNKNTFFVHMSNFLSQFHSLVHTLRLVYHLINLF